MTNQENLCTAIGCPTACCRDITLELSSVEAKRFLEGQHVNYIHMENYQVSNLDEIPSISPGFNVIGDLENSNSTVQVYIKGFCPYLDVTTYNCGIWKQAKRPGICSEVQIGDYTCDVQRGRIGLAAAKKLSHA